MRTLVEDLRDAMRGLRKQPRFLIIATLTLALGIGAVTAIFSVVNGILFTPLPYPHADRLVNIWSTAPGVGYDRFPLSPDLFLFYKRHNTTFEDMATFTRSRVNLTESGPPEVVDALMTTHTYFSTLGVAFEHGRAFNADEDKEGAPPTAVLSHRLWTRRYGADRGLVGRTVRIAGEPTTVVGVAPKWIDEQNSPDVWIPARFNAANPPTGNFGWPAVGRVKPGITPDRASTELEPLVHRALIEYIRSDNYRAFLREGRYRPLVRSMKEDLIGDVRTPLWILLGTVTMVLLVACGNVANLFLVRTESRQREIAVRAAIGGSRVSLIRKILAEAFVLACAGAALGVAVSAVTLPVLLQLAPDSIPRLERVRVDGLVLLFAAGVAMLAALVFGLAPAIRYTRAGVLACLRHGGRGSTDHPSRQRGRQLLVIAQTAMALVLLVGSGLLARSFTRLMSAEQGFDARGVLTFRVALPRSAYPKSAEVVQFGRRLVERLAQLPGVEAAGAATDLPIASATAGTAFEFDGRPPEPGKLPPIVHYSTITPGYFTALRIPLVGGQDFDTSDQREGVRTIIVNKAAAARYWPGQDPIGKRVRAAGQAPAAERPWFTVKGLVGDVSHEGLREPPRPLIYFPLTATDDRAPRAFSFVVRGRGVTSQGDAIRQAVWSLNADLPVAAVRTMSDIVAESEVEFRFTMLTLGIAAGVALVLGAIGLYGVLSYTVTLRTREIGVRIALGAQPSRVKRTIMANAAVMTAIGLTIGALGAFGLTRFLRGMLYETEPLDVPTFAATMVALFAVALLAAYLPARKAASVSPLEAMRTD